MKAEGRRQRKPVVYVIAGPNGAGKTTFAMKARQSKKSTVPAMALEGEKALKEAVAEVVAEHRESRKPLAVWHNGKAVLMAPDKAVSAVRESRATYSAKRK